MASSRCNVATGKKVEAAKLDSEINSKLSPRQLSITRCPSEYVEINGMGARVQYAAGMVNILLFFNIFKPIPAWTEFKIAQIDAGEFGETYAAAVSPDDASPSVRINLMSNGEMFVIAHGEIKRAGGWYYASFSAPCTLS